MTTLFQLAALFYSVKEIEGRKKLQKIVHILQEFGIPFDVTFGYHHYGPFSEELQHCLQAAQHDKLIKETEVPGQPPTFRFEADDRLIRLWKLIDNESLPRWADFAEELNCKSPRELETISTLVYLENLRGPSASQPQVDEEFRSLKPHLMERLEGARITLNQLRRKYFHKYSDNLLPA